MSDIQLGLCCINTVLRARKPTIYCSRTCRLDTYNKKGSGYAKELSVLNISDIPKLVDWNIQNNIFVLRLSSDMFPHSVNPRCDGYTLDYCNDQLAEIGQYCRDRNVRLTFHPGQFNVIGSPKDLVFQNTLLDLERHCDILDRMGCDQNSIMVIHGGGVYGDKEKTIKRWCDNFLRLPERVRNRLVLENCEKNFNIEDCLRVSKIVNIPIVFDTHHFDCYKLLHPEEKFKEARAYMLPVLTTWRRRNIKPKFHVSEQGSGRIGHHSDYIENIPDYLLEIPKKYHTKIDIMIEAKMKEQAILRLHEKYAKELQIPPYDTHNNINTTTEDDNADNDNSDSDNSNNDNNDNDNDEMFQSFSNMEINNDDHIDNEQEQSSPKELPDDDMDTD